MEPLDVRAQNSDLIDSGEMVPGTLEAVSVVHKALLGIGNASVKLDVRVEPPQAQPYEASYLIHLPENDLPAVGRRVVVWRDRTNPERILVNPFVADDEIEKMFNPELEALLAAAPPEESSQA
jgi:hypothetical protein